MKKRFPSLDAIEFSARTVRAINKFEAAIIVRSDKGMYDPDIWADIENNYDDARVGFEYAIKTQIVECVRLSHKEAPDG